MNHFLFDNCSAISDEIIVEQVGHQKSPHIDYAFGDQIDADNLLFPSKAYEIPNGTLKSMTSSPCSDSDTTHADDVYGYFVAKPHRVTRIRRAALGEECDLEVKGASGMNVTLVDPIGRNKLNPSYPLSTEVFNRSHNYQQQRPSSNSFVKSHSRPEQVQEDDEDREDVVKSQHLSHCTPVSQFRENLSSVRDKREYFDEQETKETLAYKTRSYGDPQELYERNTIMPEIASYRGIAYPPSHHNSPTTHPHNYSLQANYYEDLGIYDRFNCGDDYNARQHHSSPRKQHPFTAKSYYPGSYVRAAQFVDQADGRQHYNALVGNDQFAELAPLQSQSHCTEHLLFHPESQFGQAKVNRLLMMRNHEGEYPEHYGINRDFHQQQQQQQLVGSEMKRETRSTKSRKSKQQVEGKSGGGGGKGRSRCRTKVYTKMPAQMKITVDNMFEHNKRMGNMYFNSQVVDQLSKKFNFSRQGIWKYLANKRQDLKRRSEMKESK